MKIYWTTLNEMSRIKPEIFCHNLKAEGMFIGAPGTVIFRTKTEAEAAIKRAKAIIEEAET